ncbi:hypothetical protein HYV88_04325 [Candidatus Woesearchaeota archaeon]|nr:hypothetical protein [Candidatus Woesearchaeota archaeon]
MIIKEHKEPPFPQDLEGRLMVVVIKRKYGSVLRCRSFATQKAELISKLITYNLDRKLNYFLLIFRGCTRASMYNLN